MLDPKGPINGAEGNRLLQKLEKVREVGYFSSIV